MHRTGRREQSHYDQKTGQNCASDTERHVQLSVATDNQAGLRNEKKDPYGHTDSVNKDQWRDLLRNRAVGKALAVKIKSLEPERDENQQDTACQQIKFPLHLLMTKLRLGATATAAEELMGVPSFQKGFGQRVLSAKIYSALAVGSIEIPHS